MAAHRHKLDCNAKNAVLYMQNAAVNRGIRIVEQPVFAYAILKSCREYLERFFGSEHINDAALAIAKMMPESTGEAICIDEIKYDKTISRYVVEMEQGELNGVASVLLDLAEHNDSISEIFVQCDITSAHLERAAKYEAGGGRSRGVEANFHAGKRPAATPKTHSHGAATEDKLAEFCVDLTERAKTGEIGEVFCRDAEIARVVISLLHKIKCNPMLVGEPGVGKTAIVEGLAARIASGEVPERLRGTKVLSLDISSVVSGTTLRGEFEGRMKSLMNELTKERDTILFIDEIHMIVGAGDSSGPMDAGNILKSYLARGEIRCIGATTHGDYNRYLKKDGALTRRFQRIVVNEVDLDQTREIMSRLRPSFEGFHGVLVPEEAIDKIIFLTRRHISDRFFPDKAIDCLDESCARAAVMGQDVDVALVERAVSDLAGVPVSVIRRKDIDRVEDLRKKLHDRILGNSEAIDAFCDALSSACSSVASGNRPLCTLAFYGPKGVGKKSCVRIAAETLYGNQAVVEINGSEYTESHSVSKILGSPPGYVGFSEESYLFREVRRRPYSVILIYGVSLMHHAVREQFMKIVRHGKIKDSQGTEVDFRSSVIVFAEDVSMPHKVQFVKDDGDNLSEALEASNLAGIFSSTDLKIGFRPVTHDMMRAIVDLEVGELTGILEENGKILKVRKTLVDRLFKDCGGISPSEARRKIRRELEMLLAKVSRDKDEIVLDVALLKVS